MSISFKNLLTVCREKSVCGLNHFFERREIKSGLVLPTDAHEMLKVRVLKANFHIFHFIGWRAQVQFISIRYERQDEILKNHNYLVFIFKRFQPTYY